MLIIKIMDRIYILAEDKYDDYALFAAEIVDHFDKEDIHFDYTAR